MPQKEMRERRRGEENDTCTIFQAYSPTVTGVSESAPRDVMKTRGQDAQDSRRQTYATEYNQGLRLSKSQSYKHTKIKPTGCIKMGKLPPLKGESSFERYAVLIEKEQKRLIKYYLDQKRQ